MKQRATDAHRGVLNGQGDQPGVHLVHVTSKRGDVDNAGDFAILGLDRRGRAGERNIPRTKMLIIPNLNGLAIGKAGANGIGAFTGFRPVRSGNKASVFEHVNIGQAHPLVDDKSVGIAEDNCASGIQDCRAQTIENRRGDAQHIG